MLASRAKHRNSRRILSPEFKKPSCPNYNLPPNFVVRGWRVCMGKCLTKLGQWARTVSDCVFITGMQWECSGKGDPLDLQKSVQNAISEQQLLTRRSPLFRTIKLWLVFKKDLLKQPLGDPKKKNLSRKATLGLRGKKRSDNNLKVRSDEGNPIETLKIKPCHTRWVSRGGGVVLGEGLVTGRSYFFACAWPASHKVASTYRIIFWNPTTGPRVIPPTVRERGGSGVPSSLPPPKKKKKTHQSEWDPPKQEGKRIRMGP